MFNKKLKLKLKKANDTILNLKRENEELRHHIYTCDKTKEQKDKDNIKCDHQKLASRCIHGICPIGIFAGSVPYDCELKMHDECPDFEREGVIKL